MTRVAVTGAAGGIGQVVCAGLTDIGYEVVGLDVVESDGVTKADVRDVDALTPQLSGCAGVVHLAGFPGERDLATALDAHVWTTFGVLEAMRQAGVPRIVYASSNHAVGFSPRSDQLDEHARPRPDSFYAVGKVAAESLCSLYVDRYQMSAACLRIGGFRDRPANRRHLSLWLSPGDAVRLVDACLTAPDLTFASVFGVSANTRGWFDLSSARALGYEPQDDAEVYADEIQATPETEQDIFDEQHVGGSWCRVPDA